MELNTTLQSMQETVEAVKDDERLQIIKRSSMSKKLTIIQASLEQSTEELLNVSKAKMIAVDELKEVKKNFVAVCRSKEVADNQVQDLNAQLLLEHDKSKVLSAKVQEAVESNQALQCELQEKIEDLAQIESENTELKSKVAQTHAGSQIKRRCLQP
jgi:hypothetical protein